MECRKIKFRKLETRKIILRIEYQKIKFQTLETRKNYSKDGMSEI